MLRIKTEKSIVTSLGVEVAFVNSNNRKAIVLIPTVAEAKYHTFSDVKQFKFITSQSVDQKSRSIGLAVTSAPGLMW